MKIIFFSLFLSISSHAETGTFEKYATPVKKITCKELDFNSYHRVQSIKNNLLRTNPNRSVPNFAGKYLLLRNDYLFSTSWFVADCENGKFINEIFSPDHKGPKIEFKADSSLILVTGEHKDNQVAVEHHVLQNEKWMKIEEEPVSTPASEAANTATTSPAPASPSSLEIFSKYKVQVTEEKCKTLDFNSHHRAQNSKKSILLHTPDVSTPNFGGHYLLLKMETIFDVFWLQADCLSGKFLPEILTGGIYFQKDSQLVKLYSSGNFATYKVWSEEEKQWIDITDPSAKNPKGVKNTFIGKGASTLFNVIPNLDHSTTVRFENLKCTSEKCEIDLGKQKAVPISSADTKVLNELLKSWNIEGMIKFGKCNNENKSVKCEIEN